MISQGLCDTDDWNNAAENSALHHKNKLHFHIYSHKTFFFFYWNNISQFLLYLFLHQINADFLCTRAQYSKILLSPDFERECINHSVK